MKVCKVLLRECVRQTDKAYTYKIPEELEGQVTLGSYVKVPFGFGNRKQIALVVSISDESSVTGFDINKIKSIDSLLDLYPVMNKDQLALIGLCVKGFFAHQAMS